MGYTKSEGGVKNLTKVGEKRTYKELKKQKGLREKRDGQKETEGWKFRRRDSDEATLQVVS